MLELRKEEKMLRMSECMLELQVRGVECKWAASFAEQLRPLTRSKVDI